jgi:hypothetical protein
MTAVIRRLLQPTPELLDDPSPGKIAATAAITFASLTAYGFTVGFWRSAEMGAYVAVKMPLLIACTLGCNGLLNGMLGLLLGGLGFRQSLLALLSSFATAGLILGSLAPVTLMMALQFSDPESPQAVSAHAAHQLFHIALIASAGVAGALSLYRILLTRCASPAIARITLGSWVAGNGFLGAQFSWILRPFFGTPGLPVVFLWQHPLQGSFYDSVWKALRRLLGRDGTMVALLPCTVALVLIGIPLALHLQQKRNKTRP